MGITYSLADFVELFSNAEPIIGISNAEKIIEEYGHLFDLLDNQASIFYFIHDFSKFRYILISKSIKNVIGYDREALLGKNFENALTYLYPDDANNLKHVHEKIFQFFYEQSKEDRHRLRFDFNYRMKKSDGTLIQILQQSIFIAFTENGNPLYDFSTCTDIAAQKKNDRMELTIYKRNDEGMYCPVYEFIVPNNVTYNLSQRELEILNYAAQGFSSKQIAEKCGISTHTVNNHRKNILAKTDSNNLSEALHKTNMMKG